MRESRVQSLVSSPGGGGGVGRFGPATEGAGTFTSPPANPHPRAWSSHELDGPASLPPEGEVAPAGFGAGDGGGARVSHHSGFVPPGPRFASHREGVS
jgi:hypothetical protein